MADLTAARNKSRELRLDFPRRVGKLVDLIQSIRTDLMAVGPDMLPERDSRILLDKVDNLIGKIEDQYPDKEDRIDEVPEQISERLVELDATLEAVRAHLIESQSYKDFVRLLTRIDAVLPSLDFDFTNQIELLRHENENYEKEWLLSASNCLGDEILNRLAESLGKFRARQFEDSLRCASQTSQLLLAKVLSYLNRAFPGSSQLKTIYEGRKRLRDAPGDDGNRLEWQVVALAEISQWVRNCVEHPEGDAKTPGWMKQRRGLLRRDPCMARLALICQIQLAIELHELCRNEVSGKGP